MIATPRRVGRPRKADVEIPKGLRMIDGRWYWRPTDALTRGIARAMGKAAPFAGETLEEARAWVNENVTAQIPFAVPVPHVGRPLKSSRKARTRHDMTRALQMLDVSLMEKPGLVYFIRSMPGGVKIGFTRDTATLATRVTDLQVGNPNPIMLLDAFQGSQALEKACHIVLAGTRKQGEWFADAGLVIMLRARAKTLGLREALRTFCQIRA